MPHFRINIGSNASNLSKMPSLAKYLLRILFGPKFFGHFKIPPIIKRLNWVLFEDDALDDDDVLGMKIYEASLNFMLEDFVQVGLQYFYFEKFAFQPNTLLVYFNAMIMMLKALELTYRILKEMKKKWKSQERFW